MCSKRRGEVTKLRKRAKTRTQPNQTNVQCTKKLTWAEASLCRRSSHTTRARASGNSLYTYSTWLQTWPPSLFLPIVRHHPSPSIPSIPVLFYRFQVKLYRSRATFVLGVYNVHCTSSAQALRALIEKLNTHTRCQIQYSRKLYLRTITFFLRGFRKHFQTQSVSSRVADETGPMLGKPGPDWTDGIELISQELVLKYRLP